jgi:regulation of enolase protein 1 (concanavalin A-like superfamily)
VTDVWTVTGSGADIWGGADQFQYAFRPLSGDGTVTARVVSMDVTDNWAKAGLMIRESTAGGAKHAMMAMTGAYGLQFLWRATDGGDSSSMAIEGPTPPYWIRIQRTGSLLQAAWTDNPDAYWIPTDPGGNPLSVMIPMNANVTIGLVVCSHNNSALCTTVFDNVTWDVPPYNEAWGPSPADGTTDIPLTGVTLSWMAGDNATGHDVYLGTDPGALPLVAQQALGDEDYDTGPLDPGTTYYWSITETNNPEWPGPTWSFTSYAPPLGIVRQIWEGIGGVAVADLTGNPAYPSSPTWTDEVPAFDSPDLGMDNYGGRMQGQLWPETSGDYTFWIAGDDNVQLWLSSDTDPANLVQIAYHNDWTAYQEWEKFPEQKSAPVALVGGQTYLMRALWKEGGGGDSCSVAWEGPDSPTQAVIDGYYFVPSSLQACCPTPADGGTVVPLDGQTLAWAGSYRGATSQELYFGEDPGAMSLIATPSPEVGTWPTPEAVPGKTYYWKVNRITNPEVVEGPVWSYSVEEWVCQDIGTSGGASDYNEATGTWIIDADGADIWGNSDQFRYCYKKMKLTRSTGEIVARMVDWTRPGTNGWRKAGVMMRESLAANSKFVDAMITGGEGGGESFQWRDTTGGGCGSSHTHSGVTPPEWVKLVRAGDQWTAFHAEDYGGVPGPWQQEGGIHYQSQPDTVYLGLAVTSHDVAFVAQAVFDNVSIWTPDPDQAWGPSPSDGATGVPIEGAVMTWNPGDSAAEHKVYMGTDPDAMALVATKSLGDESYEPGLLDLATTYYWSVTEVNDAYEVEGSLWAFTTQEYLTIDDFEAYDDAPVPLEPLPPQEVVGGDYIEVVAEAPPEQTEVVPGYTIVPEAPPEQEWVPEEILVEAVAPDAGCLIAEWAFEGDYTDSSGSGFHGDPCGDATIVVDGDRGNVLSLDGDLDYVNCGNPTALNFSTNDWSLSAWVKNTMTGTGDENKGCIVGNGGDTGGGHRYCMIVTEQQEGEVTLVVDDDSNKRQARGDATQVNDDVWHHVLGVREGDTIKIYIDGVLEGSEGLPAGYDLSGTVQQDVLIGAITDHPEGIRYKDYAGLIDDVQIYDCALSEGNARYMAGLGNKVKPGYYSPLIVHYAMDEGSGDTAGDSSGNGFDGDISGAAWDGGALDFNGVGDYVVNNDVGPVLNGLEALSISLWIQSDVIDTDKGFIIFEDPSGSDRRGFRYDSVGAGCGGDDVIKYGVSQPTGSEEDESSAGLQTTDWQHLCMTWQEGVGITLYVNGVADTPSCNDGIETGGLVGYTKLLVGKGGKDDGADESWDGRIDDVRIYASALTYGNVRHLAGEGDLVIPPVYGPMQLHLEFEGDATDSSGNANDGTLMGDATFDAGAIGQAVALDGDGDYVNVDGYKGINAVGGVQQPFTIANWFKTTSNGEMVTWGTNAGGQRLSWRIDGGRLRTEHGSGNLRGNTYVDDGEWHHGALVVNEGANLRVPNTLLYVDGVQDSTFSGSDNTYNLTASADVAIGMRATHGDRFFPGSIDDVRIYDYALTYGNIRHLAGVGDLYIPPQYGPMVAQYLFEGDLTDATGNGRDGAGHGAIGFETDPDMGQVLDLPGGDDQYVGCPAMGISGNDPTTIACWAKADHTSIPDWTLIFGFTTSGGGCGSHFNIGSLGGPGGVGAHAWCWERTIFSDTEALDWHHYAMTYDGTNIAYYGDGIQIGVEAMDLSIRGDNVHIGSRITQTSSFPGNVEDARVYDTALTYGQILTLSGYVETNVLEDTWTEMGDADISLGRGSQWMDMAYDNSQWMYQAQARRDAPFADWTKGSADALTLWFRGNPGNAGELAAMYVTLRDHPLTPDGRHEATVAYDGEREDLDVDEWQEWNIALSDFGEVNLPGMGDIAVGVIGLGDAGNPGGLLGFDDIRLYPSRCVPKYGPLADLTGDCFVDVMDLRELVGKWLTMADGPGLGYEYYEGSWDALPDFDTLTPVKTGVVSNFDISVRNQNDNFAFRFTGEVTAPADANYTFYTSSDDGSKLYIGTTQVVDNDGLHGMQWREGTIWLTAGKHPITVTMFELGGGEGLQVEVESAGAGIPRIPIPDYVLSIPAGVLSYVGSPEADLNEDMKVNLEDYAVMMEEWLTQKWWP